MIEIRRHNGDSVLTIAEIPDGAKVHRELGGEHYVRLPFSTAEPFHLKVGDYIVLPLFGRFELTEPYQPKPNDNTGGYDYDVQFKAYYMKWQNRLCRYMPKYGGNETSFVLTSTLGTHLNVILSNINYIGETDPSFTYEGVPFDYQFRNLDVETQTKAKVKSYQNTDIISALSDLASIFECEWWVDDNHICFGRLELNEVDPVDFVYGTKSVDEGKVENVETMSSSSSKNEYATRIYAFGASRNLPSNYRKTEGADITKNGVVQKRLMLPADTCPHGYYEEESAAQGEVVEAVMIDEDIYPKVDLEIARIETYEDTTTDPETEEEVTYTYYRLFDDSDFTKNFTEEMILEGETLHILFQSGPMNGMDFEVHFEKKDDVTKNYWEVIMNEDYGRPLPDTSLHPEVENKFVIYNWDSTKIEDTGIIDRAEEELYQAVVKKLADMKIDPNTYTCNMRSDWYERNMHETIPDDHYRIYDFGQRVRLYNAAYFEDYRLSRIIGYEICLDIPYDKPQYIVGEATVYSRLADMQGQIDSLTMNGVAYNGSGGGSGIYLITTTSTARPSDTNAYSALRSGREFLSKTKPDTAAGHITFSDGITVRGNAGVSGSVTAGGSVTVGEDLTVGGDAQMSGKTSFGTFVSGMTGGQVDEYGNAEFESLRARSYIMTEEMLVNRLQGQEGDTLYSDNDQIDDVETYTDATDGITHYVLTLREKWEGYFTAQQYGNIVKGIVNTFAAKGAGVSDYTSPADLNYQDEDNGGNYFYTSWMMVYATHNTARDRLDVNQIDVVLYGDTAVPARRNFPPCRLMTIARWGCYLNPADYPEGSAERNSIIRRQRLFEVSVTDGRIVKLAGVNSPMVTAGNFGMTLGELPDYVKAYPDVREVLDRVGEHTDWLYAQGVAVVNYIKVDKEGVPVPHPVYPTDAWVDGGTVQDPRPGYGIYYANQWNEDAGQFETHYVTHRGVVWQCLQSQPVVSGGVATYYEPKWNSPYWRMVDGNDNLSIEFTSSRGDKFYQGHVNTDVTPHLYYGNVDISSDIDVQYWSWQRETESGKTPQDESWDARHVGVRVLHLTNEEMPTAWGRNNKAVFTCTVTVNDGKQDIIVQNQVIA